MDFKPKCFLLPTPEVGVDDKRSTIFAFEIGKSIGEWSSATLSLLLFVGGAISSSSSKSSASLSSKSPGSWQTVCSPITVSSRHLRTPPFRLPWSPEIGEGAPLVVGENHLLNGIIFPTRERTFSINESFWSVAVSWPSGGGVCRPPVGLASSDIIINSHKWTHCSPS